LEAVPVFLKSCSETCFPRRLTGALKRSGGIQSIMTESPPEKGEPAGAGRVPYKAGRRILAEPLCFKAVLLVDLGSTAMLSTLLLIVLVLLLIGALPSWPYSRSWGYAPSGLLTLVVVVVVLLAVTGRL
jgi:hypothetical protein